MSQVQTRRALKTEENSAAAESTQADHRQRNRLRKRFVALVITAFIGLGLWFTAHSTTVPPGPTLHAVPRVVAAASNSTVVPVIGQHAARTELRSPQQQQQQKPAAGSIVILSKFPPTMPSERSVEHMHLTPRASVEWADPNAPK